VFAAAGRAAAACRQAGASLVIDDRADFALLLEAGLHVGQSDLPPEDARRLLGPDALLGLSCHDAEQLLAAAAAPVDYAALGPVFPTASKRQPDAVVGLADLRRWRALIPKPLAAIGGITLENAVEVWRAGADAAAIIAGLLPDPSTARGLRDRMEQWRRLATTV
jgi:thiamine-phosphate pyrophosphorylase